MERKEQQEHTEQQSWQAHTGLKIAYRVWRVLFAAMKIAVGAFATVFLVVFISGFVFAGMLGSFLEDEILPSASLDLSDLTLDLNSTIYYIDDDKQIQVQQEIDAKIDRKWVEYEDIPEHMINAAIAVEDHRFYKHQGVDWITTIQA